MKFEPTSESVKQHEIPKWFHDAKLGIFIHFGLFSVPAFGVTGINLIDSMKRGAEVHFKNNPYAEWYLNSLRIEGSPTQKYHKENYGENFKYEDFVPLFNKGIRKWDPNKWVSLFKKIGAKYVILTTKHCEGFLLWPSKYPNPNKENFFADRDIVGELTTAVKKEGIKMGFYYSSAWDWSFNLFPIKDGISFTKHYVQSLKYAKWVTNHWYELIDRYQPQILWSDMGYPAGTDPNEIFAYYYNKIAEGVVNNRWNQYLAEEKRFRSIHYDYKTPEYKIEKRIKKIKWEVCRGIGNSFGYNKFESEEDYLTSEDLIFLLVDVVSKNGNLLLNVGPTVDGKIPELQEQRLLELGKWLDVNGEAIFGTRPWKRAEGTMKEDIPLRFTCKNEIIFVIILGKPEKNELIIKDLASEDIFQVFLLGVEESLNWRKEEGDLIINLMEYNDDSPAISLKITLS